MPRPMTRRRWSSPWRPTTIKPTGAVPGVSIGKVNAQRVYWIFNYKRDTFYPFVPKGDKERDMERELRLRAAMARELPLENEPERWFPLWDVPL